MELGTPFITSFDYQDYDAHSQNWAAVQDDRGVMYFGNGDGVLRFDGVSWHTIPVANQSIVRSLDVDRSGTVFVGAVNELGFLRADAIGTSTYVSLLHELDTQDRNLGDVWRTYAIDDGIFFWTSKKLFRWRDGRFKSWTIDSHMVCCRVGDKLFYNQRGKGLMMLEGDVFRALTGSEALGDVKIMTMLPYSEGRILIGTRDGTMWLMSWAKEATSDRLIAEVARFRTAADNHLARHQLYTGARLADGAYAFATMTGGSLVIDHQGALRYRFDKSNGLLDDSVWALYVDREHGLWHAMNHGITRVELGTPITGFGEVAGLPGTVEAAIRFEGALHVATSLGFYRLEGSLVREISNQGAPYWSLLVAEVPGGDRGTLLVGATRGVFELGPEGAMKELLPTRNAFHLYQSKRQPELIYVGDMEGVSVLQRVDGEWASAGRLQGIDKEVRGILEDEDGQLWLGTHFDGVIRLRVDLGAEPRVTDIQHFGLEHGLPVLKSVKIHDHFGRPLFVSEAGLMRFDPQAQRFEPSDLLGPEHQQTSILRWRPDTDGNVWISQHNRELCVAIRQTDGSYVLDTDSLKRLEGQTIHAVVPEPDGVVWFGGVNGLYRFDAPGRPATSPAGLNLTAEQQDDLSATQAREAPFSAWIRRVSVAQPGGKLLFDGGRLPSRTPPILTHAEASLRFEYAMPRFDGRKSNLYRSRLVGLEDTWSEWTDETYRDFTSLREGRYRFEITGRDVYHRTSEVTSFDFRVQPPWYRTWWAYTLYALALASATWALLTWLLRRARLEMEVGRLAEANAIMQRTEQERQQFVHELEAKNSEMERFIYTVSHDLKSPLISIRGFLGMLEQDIAAGEQARMHHDMERIRAATGKMAHLVDELLQLSTIGRQTHEPQEVAMDEVAREAADQVAGLIAEHQAEVVIAPDLPPARGDRQRLQALMQNLIENGVKYMGEQPTPRIEIDHLPNGDETVYRVRDNGVGIDSRYQEKIFGLFERLSTTTEGTGVGLALAKRIVDVHGGRIWVESEGEGTGSTFCFTLP